VKEKAMPEISRFFGIVIYMYFNDHDPPHFHAKYNEFRGKIAIEDLRLVEGNLPRRVIALILEWANEYREELLDNWSTLRKSGSYEKIKPLI
jgi:Domain of unknown function (DUF4160)